MNRRPKLRTTALCSVLLAFSLASVQAPVLAGMIGNEELAAQTGLQAQRDEVRNFMARDDVRQLLLDYGVSSDAVDARINSLTPGELQQLQARIDQLPAGGEGVLGVVLAIILIFVLLDLLGATDVFPNI